MMRDRAADARLRQLLTSSPDETVRHFAKGCLSNMKAVLAPNFSAASAMAARGNTPSRPAPSGTSALTRYTVPADNNCLFTSCAVLCDERAASCDPSTEQNHQLLTALARELRVLMANMMKSNPDAATALAIVGCEDAEAYRHWIADETHWGGEPEVSMLAEIYQVEIIVAVCGYVSTRKVLKYGGGSDRPTVYLLYTGQHYDPLVGPPPARARQFAPVKRDMAGASARGGCASDRHRSHPRGGAKGVRAQFACRLDALDPSCVAVVVSGRLAASARRVRAGQAWHRPCARYT